MTEQCIEFERNERAEEYLVSVFEQSNIKYIFDIDSGRASFKFLATDEVRNGIICGIILNFYKLRELTKVLGSKASGKAFYAFMGALIGLEQEDETDSIMELLGECEVANIDGFYNFRLDNLRESWENLAKLSERLYSQCKSEEDIYALSIFMLGMDENISATVVVNRGEELYWEKNGTKIAVVPYFGDRETDTIMTLLSQRPSDVVVMDPTGVSQGLMTVIRALGE